MKAHPMRARAIQIMKRGQATPGELATALRIKPSLVRDWRRRAGKIDTAKARLHRVWDLLYPGNKFDE